MSLTPEETVLTLPEINNLAKEMLLTLKDQHLILESLTETPSSLNISKIDSIHSIHSQFAPVFLFLEQAYWNWKQEDLADLQKSQLEEYEHTLIRIKRTNAQIEFFLDHYEAGT